MNDYAGELAHWEQLATNKQAELDASRQARDYAGAEIQVLAEEIEREKAALSVRLNGGGSPNRPPHTIAMRIASHEAAVAVLTREVNRLEAVAADQAAIVEHARSQAAHFRVLASTNAE